MWKLFVGVVVVLIACGAEPETPTVQPDATATIVNMPELTTGEVKALVRKFLVPKKAGGLDLTCDEWLGRLLEDPAYLGDRIWKVSSTSGTFEWRVYEGTLIVESLNGIC